MGGNSLDPTAAEVAEAVAREVTAFNLHTSRAGSAAVGVEDKDVPGISDALLGPRIAVLASKVLEESLIQGLRLYRGGPGHLPARRPSTRRLHLDGFRARKGRQRVFQFEPD